VLAGGSGLTCDGGAYMPEHAHHSVIGPPASIRSPSSCEGPPVVGFAASRSRRGRATCRLKMPASIFELRVERDPAFPAQLTLDNARLDSKRKASALSELQAWNISKVITSLFAERPTRSWCLCSTYFEIQEAHVGTQHLASTAQVPWAFGQILDHGCSNWLTEARSDPLDIRFRYLSYCACIHQPLRKIIHDSSSGMPIPRHEACWNT
jgi:hypothetical protein